MAKDELTLGAAAIQRGKALIGPVEVPSAKTTFDFHLDRTLHVHPGVLVRVAIETSVNAGSTWQEQASVSSFGGTSTRDDDGKPVTDFQISTSLPVQVGSVKRQIRVVIDSGPGSFSTAGGKITVE